MKNGQEIVIVPSIGIAVYPQHGHKLEKLLIAANRAVRYARQQQEIHYYFYQRTLEIKKIDPISLDVALHYALERQEFELYYQPRINLKTGQIASVEVFLRWNHPKHGLLFPEHFLASIEETDRIVSIGKWIFKTACETVKKWQDMGASSLRLAINLSMRQLDNFQSFLFDICDSTKLRMKYIELDLSEALYLQKPEIIAFKLQSLKTLGVKIALDDLGNGYSSLLALKKLPFDILKIERCFIQNIHRDLKNQVIVDTIVRLARDLNLNLVAEGIETSEELAYIDRYHWREVQGFFFSHPLPAKELEKLLLSSFNIDDR